MIAIGAKGRGNHFVPTLQEKNIFAQEVEVRGVREIAQSLAQSCSGSIPGILHGTLRLFGMVSEYRAMSNSRVSPGVATNHSINQTKHASAHVQARMLAHTQPAKQKLFLLRAQDPCARLSSKASLETAKS